jgi:hypothetical protein
MANRNFLEVDIRHRTELVRLAKDRVGGRKLTRAELDVEMRGGGLIMSDPKRNFLGPDSAAASSPPAPYETRSTQRAKARRSAMAPAPPELHREPPDAHSCLWPHCTSIVRGRLYACAEHWRRIPPFLVTRLWDAYHEGQERTLDISPAWIAAHNSIQAWIATQEKSS